MFQSLYIIERDKDFELLIMGKEDFVQNDFLLIRKMKQGDDDALDLFVHKYYQDILNYCHYHCSDKTYAEDLAQETFVHFFSKLSDYHYRGKTLNYLYTIAREGYRTQEEQQQLLDEKIEAYENEGKSKSEAKKLAEQWVAIPGTSEHQLGIAVDINADTTKSSSDDVYSWLAENAHKYGFIKRYPSDKTDITGVINEPWHYRYVGKEAALEIYSQGMCLEEYIDTLE